LIGNRKNLLEGCRVHCRILKLTGGETKGKNNESTAIQKKRTVIHKPAGERREALMKKLRD